MSQVSKTPPGTQKPTQEEDMGRDVDAMGKEDRGILGAVRVLLGLMPWLQG